MSSPVPVSDDDDEEVVTEITPEIEIITDIFQKVEDVLLKEYKYDTTIVNSTIETLASTICGRIYNIKDIKIDEKTQNFLESLSWPVIGAFLIQLHKQGVKLNLIDHHNTFGIPPIAPQTPILNAKTPSTTGTASTQCLGFKQDKQRCSIIVPQGSTHCHHHISQATTPVTGSTASASASASASMTPKSPNICAGKKAKGEPCQLRVKQSERYCHHHKSQAI